jgi:serine/threonine-protein kinase RsbW
VLALVFGFLGGKSGEAVDRSFPARPWALHQVRRFIRDRAEEIRFHDDVTEDLVQAVSEAAANCVRHADADDIKVSWRSTAEGAEVLVLDDGVFRPMPDGPRRSDSEGFGLPLIEALVDEVSIQEGTTTRPGTSVRLVKYKR